MEDHDQDEYAREEENNTMDLNHYESEIGSHQFMPKTFVGLDTSKLGFHIQGQKSPYLELKEKIISEATTLCIEDRMQGVRYLCSIPYNNGTAHCLEAAMSVLRDENIDIYKRFYFMHSKEKYLRLDDHVVYYLYGAFFKQGKRAGPLKYPFDVMFPTVEYILKNYTPDLASRQNALEWLMDIIEDQMMDDGSKCQAITILQNCGDFEEKSWATDQCIELYNVESPADVETEDGDVRDILRGLRTSYALQAEETPETLFVKLCQLVQSYPNKEETEEQITAFFNDILPLNETFEGIKISDICILFHKCVEKLDKFAADNCLREFVATISNVTSEDILIPDVVRILTNFVLPKPLVFAATLLEKLRNDVFAGLNASLMQLNPGLRSEVEQSRNSNDKSAAQEFMMFFEDEIEVIFERYAKEYQLGRKEFDGYITRITKEWMNDTK